MSKGGFSQTSAGDWFKRVNNDGTNYYFHRSDLGRKAYVKMVMGLFYIFKGNINSLMNYAHAHNSKHPTLEGAKAALLITLASLT